VPLEQTHCVTQPEEETMSAPTIGRHPAERQTPDVDHESQRTASLTAGLALLLLAVLAPLATFTAIGSLLTPGDPAATVQDILASEAQFRWGIATLILVAVLDIVVAAALLTLFEPVNRSISVMAAWFRLAYAAVYLVGISQLAIALALLGNPEQAVSAIDAFDTIWHVGLVLCGVHLLLIGYLAYRSGFMSKVIGILLLVAGLGYVVDAFGAVLSAGYTAGISRFTFVGEAVLIFWLLIKGRRMPGSHSRPDNAGRPLSAQ
jgi:phosphoglycerol transferase MdoB-like AlkP superfamily enzyme